MSTSNYVCDTVCAIVCLCKSGHLHCHFRCLFQRFALMNLGMCQRIRVTKPPFSTNVPISVTGYKLNYTPVRAEPMLIKSTSRQHTLVGRLTPDAWCRHIGSMIVCCLISNILDATVDKRHEALVGARTTVSSRDHIRTYYCWSNLLHSRQ